MRAPSGLDLVGVEVAELRTRPDGTTGDLDPLVTALGPVIDLVVAG